VKIGIRRRIVLALLALVLLVAAAALLAVLAHRSLHDELDRVAIAERQSRACLELSLAVRDMYAHQAHTIILDDRSHLDHYGDARTQVMALVDVVRGLLSEAADRDALAEIERLARAFEDNFQSAIVPAIGGPRQALVGPHDRALALVEAIAREVDGLTIRFRQRADEAQVRAEVGNAHELAWHIGLVIAAALFAAAVGAYLTRALARPLGELRAVASRLATGDLSTRIVEPVDDDFGALARAFNTMATDLQTHEARLVAAEKLASVGRLAAGIAHEISNPLAVILGHAHLLQRSGDGQVADDARRIRLEAERCQEIVQGLLDLSRPARLALTEVDLYDLVGDVAASLPTAELVSEVVIDPIDLIGPGARTVPGDARKLRQILWNLLRNAAEAAPGRPIRVRFQATSDTLSMAVSDEGPGIDPAIADQLFEPFHTSKAGGTGLGLAVSRVLALAHRGTLELASNRPTTFVLTLPRAASRDGA